MNVAPSVVMVRIVYLLIVLGGTLLILQSSLTSVHAAQDLYFVRSASEADNSQSFNIGAASNDRLLVVFAAVESSGTNLTNVTADGKSCVLGARTNNATAPGSHLEMWYCDEDNLTTSNGTVTVALTGGSASWDMNTFLYYGVSQNGPFATTTNTANSSATISVSSMSAPARGVVMMSAAGASNTTYNAADWTAPLAERLDQNNDNFTFASASGDTVNAFSGKTLTAIAATSNTSATAIAASWERSTTAEASGSTLITDSTTISGDVNVVNYLWKGAGTFVIDHPLDPENKLLYHSFVESPDVKNIYDGVATLNADGEATIELPSYFIALNKDYRYQVSALSESMPNLYLKSPVRKRFFGLFGAPLFTVGGGKAGGEISWQVTGIRHDPYILAHPIVPEVEKGPDAPFDRGEYVHQELYAQ